MNKPITQKILWICYLGTFVIFSIIFLLQFPEKSVSGTVAYRLISFYIAIPLTAVVIGSILGLYKDVKNAYVKWGKWLYPVFTGVLSFLISRTNVVYFLAPFIIAFIGIGIGVILKVLINKMSVKAKSKLKTLGRMLSIAAVVIVLVHVIHALTLDRIIEYKELSFYSPNIPAQMNGYKIAFIADTHSISEKRLQGIVDELNNRKPDLAVHGGDFSRNAAEMQRTVKIMSRINTTDGFFAVDGNHDEPAILYPELEKHNIVPLANTGLYIRDNFFLAGVEDPWDLAGGADVTGALAGSRDEDFILLISHNPDVAMQQNTVGADLILSGHTHGGQLNFFGLWSLGLESRVISQFGERFRSGWSESRDGTPVYVCRGIGEYYPRVFARPEVTLITLVRE